ncbi:MAG: GNAT family N-acetyltransferase [Aggregatilineales bacterium]
MVLKSENAALDATFTIRPAQMEDLQTATDLFNAADRPFFHADLHDLEETKAEWENPQFNMETSTLAVFTAEGQMVGYIEIFDYRAMPVRPWIWGRIHPDYEGRGIGTHLFEWVEKRSYDVFDRVPEDAAITLMTGVLDKKTDACRFLEDMGMTSERSGYTMLMEMDEAPEPPTMLEGIRIVNQKDYNADMQAIFAAVRGSFQDHRGFVDEPFDVSFERWQHFWTNDPHYDPAAWLLALDGDDIVGISLCRAQSHEGEDRGHVHQLGVIREYRRRGIAMALLRQTFVTFWERGKRKVDLGVDGSSITNAVALYERAGMSIEKVYLTYEKELRPGKEYSNQ